MQSREVRLFGLLGIIAASTPAALGFETALRHALFPPEFEEVRAWLGPSITPWIWGMLPATVLATLGGVRLQGGVFRRELARLRKRWPDAQAQDKARFEALMLATSAPQIPALVATMGFMLGASLTPVLLTIGLATLGVLTLGVVLPAQSQRLAQ